MECTGGCEEHGECISGVCTCDIGWSGENCAEEHIAECPTQCMGSEEQASASINEAGTEGGKGNIEVRGFCKNDNTCACYPGFTGEMCEIRCKNRCSGVGECKAVDKSYNSSNEEGYACVCIDGYVSFGVPCITLTAFTLYILGWFSRHAPQPYPTYPNQQSFPGFPPVSIFLLLSIGGRIGFREQTVVCSNYPPRTSKWVMELCS